MWCLEHEINLIMIQQLITTAEARGYKITKKMLLDGKKPAIWATKNGRVLVAFLFENNKITVKRNLV